MDYLIHGWSVDEMCEHHPYLSNAEAHAAMLYYWDHQEEIDQEIAQECEQAQREKTTAELPSFLARLRADGSK
jgi:hypothetical protein